MTDHRTESLTAADGTALLLHRWGPAAPAARLLVLHGRGEHGGRYAELAGRLAGLGLATDALDRRGYGQSEGPRGSIRRFAEYGDDLRATLAHLDQPPRFILAHSAGALVVLRHLQQTGMPLDGLILSSPFLAKSEPVTGIKMLLVRLLSLVTPHRPLPRSGVEHLTRDATVQQQILDDPLGVPSATPRWFTEALAAQRVVFAEAERIEVPLLILQGGADRSADPAGARRLFERVGSSDKRLEVYPELYHEVLHELPEDRARVYEDLLGWLAPRI